MKDYEKEQLKKWEYLAWAIEMMESNGCDLEDLKRKAKARGLFGAPPAITEKELKAQRDYVVTNMMVTMQTCFLYALKESEGFGKKRLSRVQDAFAEVVRIITETDYAGMNYVCISDIAVELNSKYKLGLDLSRLEGIERENEAKAVHMVSRERIVSELIRNGFEEAAEFLARK